MLHVLEPEPLNLPHGLPNVLPERGDLTRHKREPRCQQEEGHVGSRVDASGEGVCLWGCVLKERRTLTMCVWYLLMYLGACACVCACVKAAGGWGGISAAEAFATTRGAGGAVTQAVTRSRAPLSSPKGRRRRGFLLGLFLLPRLLRLDLCATTMW